MNWELEHFSDLSACWYSGAMGQFKASVEFSAFELYRVWVWADGNDYDYETWLEVKGPLSEAMEVAESLVVQLLADEVSECFCL